VDLIDVEELKLCFLGVVMNEIKVPVETLNAILGYLGTKPYQEVCNLIQTVQALAKEQLQPPKEFE
jgi:hypothetical protein